MQFRVETSTTSSWAVISAFGELDLYTVALLKDELTPILESESRVLFDFTQLRYLDSTAIGVVVGACKAMKEKGGLARLVCSEPVRKIFALTGLHKQIRLYASVAEATEDAASTNPKSRFTG